MLCVFNLAAHGTTLKPSDYLDSGLLAELGIGTDEVYTLNAYGSQFKASPP
jgi:hypothetical protein